MIRLGLQILALVLLVLWIGGEVAALSAKVGVVARTIGRPAAAVPPTGSGNDGREPVPRLDATAFPQTLARPIFFAERRFPAVQAKAALASRAQALTPVAPKVGAEKIKLRGVMLTHGKKRALLESPSGAIGWVGLDETIDGWTVSALDANAVTLTQGALSATIALYPENP